MLRFNPAFWWTLRPGASAVPRTDRVMPFTRRSSIPTQPWPDLNRAATGRPSLHHHPEGRRTETEIGSSERAGPTGGPPVRAARCRLGRDSEVHVAAAGGGGGRLLLLGLVGDDRLGGEEQPGDRGRVLERGPGHLGRVDDPRLEQVDVLAGGRVEAMAGLHSTDPLDHHAALEAGVDGDLLQRLLERAVIVRRALEEPLKQIAVNAGLLREPLLELLA